MTTIDTITTAQIRALSDEAGAHGDLEQVEVCERALNGSIKAIAKCVRVIRSAELNAEAPAGAVAYKYADPTEDARWIFDADEAREIAGEDTSLIADVTGLAQEGDKS